MGFFDRLLGGKPGDGEADGVGASPEATAEQINMACAALLLEVAEADYVDDPAETEAILHALKTELDLDQGAVRALLDRARQETGRATDLFPYAHLLNQRLEREQKCAILTAMWRVAMADEVLDKYEDQLLRRITELLRLEHSDFIAAKQAARPMEN